MAPGSPMKRRSSSHGRAAKKARSTNLVPIVVNAICGSESVPGDVRVLLKQTLPIVLKANKDDRHAYEALVVDEAQRALAMVQKEREQARKDALTKQNEVISPAEEKKRQTGKDNAENKLAAAKAKVEERKAALKAAEKAEEAAEDDLKNTTRLGTEALRKATHDGDHAVKAAQKEDAAAGHELQKYFDKHTIASNELANEFVMLKDGTSASADGKKALQKLLALGKEYGLDGTLLGVLPMAAKKVAAARSEFEGMAFMNLHSLMARVINELSQKVAELEPIKGAKLAAVGAAEQAKAQAVANAEASKTQTLNAAMTLLDAAKADTTVKEAELCHAQEERSEASKELAKADLLLRHIWEDMRHACDAQDEAAHSLKTLQEDVFAAFHQLKEKQPEPEPMEEEAAPEAVPEAEASVPQGEAA